MWCTFLYMSHALHSALENGQEAIIMQFYVIAGFDMVNHQEIIYKICSVGINQTSDQSQPFKHPIVISHSFGL